MWERRRLTERIKSEPPCVGSVHEGPVMDHPAPPYEYDEGESAWDNFDRLFRKVIKAGPQRVTRGSSEPIDSGKATAQGRD